MELGKIKNEEWKIDFSSVFFSIIALIFGAFAYLIPNQSILFLAFMIIAGTIGIILFYIKKINLCVNNLFIIDKNIKIIYKEMIERFNYLREIDDIKREIGFLKMENKKTKRAQINLEDIFKIIVAIILIYVISQVIKSLSG